MEIELSQIKQTERLQPRVQINFLIVDDYAEAMKNDNPFPPVELVFDGNDYWLWDGFHRIEAVKKIEKDSIEANITEGTLQDAEWLCLSANKDHGLHRTNADKRRAVLLAFEHENSKSMTDTEIAEHCGVSQPFVGKLRPSITVIDTRERRNGTSYTVKQSPTEKLTPEVRELIAGTWIADSQIDIEELSNIRAKDQIKVVNLVLNDASDDIKQAKKAIDIGVHFSSNSSEWYTPPYIIEKAIHVLGHIDLDPCSNGKNDIPAANILTLADNGLLSPWNGSVYMNPPYGREIVYWIDKLIDEYEKGNTREAISLTPSRTDTTWFRKLRPYPRCFIWGRLRFSDWR